MSLGAGEILFVLVIALIVLGPERLPQAARQIGKAIGELKRMSSSVQSEIDSAMRFDEPSKNDSSSSERVSSSDPSLVEKPNPPNPNTEGFRLIDGPEAKAAPSQTEGLQVRAESEQTRQAARPDADSENATSEPIPEQQRDSDPKERNSTEPNSKEPKE